MIGESALEIANAEHWVYDAFLGKPYSDYINSISSIEDKTLVKQLIEKIRTEAEKMNSTQRADYYNYLNEVYKNARRVESDLPKQPIIFPNGVNNSVSIESLLKTEKFINELKKGTANKQEIIQFLN